MQPHHVKYGILNDFEVTTAAIHAFNQLLTAALNQGDPLADIALGISHLLDTQCKALGDIEEAVRGEFRRIDQEAEARSTAHEADPRNLRKDFIASKLEAGFDAGEIAGALNLKRATVEKVIRQLRASPTESDDRGEDDRTGAVA